MKLYVASQNKYEAQQVAVLLTKAGHELTSNWAFSVAPFHTWALSVEERKKIAIDDIEDVKQAVDGVVLIANEMKLCPGGKHTETGVALALGRRVYVLGEPENIFHWHPLVTVCTDMAALLAELQKTPAKLMWTSTSLVRKRNPVQGRKRAPK